MNEIMSRATPARLPRTPAHAVPNGAADCHTHIFEANFPFANPPSYAPPLAPVERHLAMLDAMGLTHGVAVQPSPYGFDPSVLMRALESSGGRLRGIGVADGDISDTLLQEMRAAGIRGLRFVEARLPDGSPYNGAVTLTGLAELASRMVQLGWHAEIWGPLSTILAALPALTDTGLPIVLDHMGGFDPQLGVAHSDFQRLLAMVREGSLWVKLTLCRRLPIGSDLSALRPFHDALVLANPDRLLWGSDWPFVRMDGHTPDAGELFDLFCAWVDDPALLERILVVNPSRRYGFLR
jgi:2-pyrone-4,6-dicarboxylate lactonase